MRKKESRCAQVTGMGEQKILTLDFIKSLVESAYTLVWADRNDDLDNHCGLIQKCLNGKDHEHLREKTGEWYSNTEWEAVREIIAKLKGECAVFYDFGGGAVDGPFGEYEGEICDEVYSRNDSDVMKELVRHTDDVPIRMEMPSNYNCISSNRSESQSGYRYEESYPRDMVDSPNLNPMRVRKILTEHGYRAHGCFSSCKSRDDKKQVSYEQFYEKLINSCCEVNLLIYIDRVSLKELYGIDLSLKEVIIPKGNCYGLFSSTYSGGNLLGMELERGVKPKLEVKGYYGLRSRLDNEHSKYDYSARRVYRVGDSFFGGAVCVVS